MNYALLGHIAFDLLNAPTSLTEKSSATFAQHNVLAGKPKLQAMGSDLDEITLDLRLHYKLGDVESRYQALYTAKESHQALALVLGFSKFKGHFVITEISSPILFTDDDGNALSREVSITLKEFVGNTQKELQGLALQIGNNSPLGSLLPKGAVELINQTKNLINQGIKVYRQTKQVVSDIRNTTTLMRNFANDPLNALSHLPAVLSRLDVSITGLENTLGLQNSFTLLTQGIQGTQYFMRDIAELSESLNVIKTEFKRGLNSDDFGDWFDLGVKEIGNAEEVLERMAKPVAQMTAWIVLRQDTQETENE
ncbi:phage tail protein [Phocoenobacter skyensis]|uniref:Phage tail protein n=1 Tax=Phocoenobacter skyensis TaxID=97481 RepID=A0ABT9JN18_9PAST|nr:phage tail protein [Pasteurella skyensis]MDP8080251.1 phage tail protein [Pasteurella skyensis]MDP8086210.1 phage tail protein [Pasteurella skyensis]